MQSEILKEKLKGRKILFIGSFVETSAIKSPYDDLFLALTSRGWSVTRTLSKRSRFSRMAAVFFSIVFGQRNYDKAVVMVYSGLAFYWAEAAVCLLAALKKPFIAALHGGDLPAFASRHPERFRRLLLRAQRVVTPSFCLQEKLSSAGAEIQYLPNGLDLEKFYFKPRDRAGLRICWVRTLHRIYDPETAVEMADILRPEFPGISLILVGPDSGDGTMQNLRSLISQRGLQDVVSLRGAVPNTELRKLFEETDIFLNTTTVESFGVSVMEAAASGLCVVSSSAGEIPRLWKDGANALLFHPGDAKGAAAAVGRLLREPGLAARLSREGRKNAERFDWDSITPQWEKILSDDDPGIEA